MPLHGKIVVIKRSGGDGTEFPLTASCMFGRKPDCDIRIQLPQVSKEHCRIDLNENKEVILTNLSSVNPTCVNGQALQQSERLKHGDVITIIDRSFRFEYPPAPTPKKRSSVGGKADAVATDPHLKDGTNIDNIQWSLEKTQEAESKADVSLSENKTASPFNDLYEMIKKSLDVKTPRKSSVSVLQTPSSKFTTPKPESARKSDSKPAVGGKGTPKKEQTPVPPVAAENVHGEEGSLSATPKSAKRRPLQVPAAQTASNAESTSPRRNATPQKFTVSEAVEQISTQTPKSPLRRRSKETTSPVSVQKKVASPAKTDNTCKTTPKSTEKVKEKPKKRKSEEFAADLPTQQMKKKRVSFGGQLSPELFDKRLPPDSPLRKGATPRRSLCLYKPKQSLLRRASVIGLLKECDQEKHLVKSPKAKSPAKITTPSPKKSPGAKSASPKTPTPAKKSPKSPKTQSPKGQSPKSKTPSPKTPSPGKKAATPKKASPKTQSPKSVKTTPAKSPVQSKAVTPKQRKSTSSTEGTPKGKSPAPAVMPVKTPLPSGDQTPTVQGRFSVSRISTPSPVAVDAVTELVPSAMVTPKIPLKRKSMKSSAKKTPALKSATKVMRRKSGMMRASMKVTTSWADIVRFGKAKVQVVVPPIKQAPKKTTKKKTVPKPQTPKRRLVDHVSTGHAASPVTIVVGRAHRLRVAHATGAPPKIVTNTAVLRKNMKMDDDLTGISEMFKTPINEKKRQLSKLERSATKTPLADVSKSMVEPSVLNTPEETGEMVVSPMSVASTIKGRRYNSEAIQRLLCGEEESHLGSDIPLDIQRESTEQQSTEINTCSPKTPQQKLPMPEGLTGVKRMMKTPKQKSQPVEDLRGKLLKTPKQKLEQQECLSAVKRIMKTPKEKASPVEDLRGKLLKTPKQKIQQQEVCLTGVKRIMKTPKEKAVPVEDLRGKLLKTPKQKTKQQEECLSGIKMIMKTPDQKIEQPECITAVKRIMTPKQKNEPADDLSGKPLTIEQPECLTGEKRFMRIPNEKSEPLEDIRGKLLQTPKQKNEQPQCLTGVKRIMMTPAQKSEEVDTEGFLPDVKRMQRTPKEKSSPVEDMVGVKRLKTPKEKAQPVEKNFGIKRLMRSPRLRGNAPVEDFEGLEELMKEPVEDESYANTEDTIVDDQLESMETVPEPAADDQLKSEKIIARDGVMTFAEEPVQEESAPETKPVGGRRAKPKVEENKQEGDQEAIEAPVRCRRGRKVEASAALTSRQTTRSKNTKTTEDKKTEEQEESATDPKPRRGRLAKKASQAQTEKVQIFSTVPTAVSEAASVPSLPVADNEAEEQVVKPRRGRKAKAAEPSDARQAAEATESKQTMPSVNQEDGSNAVETSAPVVSKSAPQAETAEPSNPKEQKKPARGRKPKLVDTKEADEKKEEVLTAAEDKKDKEISEEAVAPVRGRKGKRTDAPVAPAVRQRRGRAGKAQNATEEVTKTVPEETKQLPEMTPEHVDDQTSAVNENSVSEPTEEAVQEKPRGGKKTKSPVESPQPEPEIIAERNEQPVVDDAQSEQPVPAEKPKRGRKAKTQVEPQPEPESEKLIVDEPQPVVEDNQPEHTIPNEKPKRGRRAKTQVEPQPEPESTAVEDDLPVEEPQTEHPTAAEKLKRGRKTRNAEDTHATEVPQAFVRGKRGRTAKLEEEEKPAPEELELKRMRRTKKTEQQQEGQSEEIQMMDAAEEASVIEQACPAPKSRRGVQKTKEADNVISEKTTDVSVSSSTDKPMRGRRGKQSSEERTAAEMSEQAPKDDSAKAKPIRGRGKTTVKHEVSDAAPAKRARRGTAISTEKSTAEATEEVSEPAPVEPVKKGRRAAAKTICVETVSKDQDNSTEKSSNAVEDTKTSKRSVKWKADLEVFEISKVTPVKAIRGRNAKSANHTEAESNSEPKNATNPEEKDLSEKAQPAKRARRGAKAADVAEESAKTNVDNTEAETQPKIRRSRLTKK